MKRSGFLLRKAQYDQIVRTLISKERVELWDRCEADSWKPKRTSVRDWKLELAMLRQDYSHLKH